MNLPKQWRHWCKESGLKPTYKRRKRYSWYALIGHGYHWRITASGMFQRGDRVEDFDRWALSEQVSHPMPRTQGEFTASVNAMLRGDAQ